MVLNEPIFSDNGHLRLDLLQWSHRATEYVRRNRKKLKGNVLRQIASSGKPAVPILAQALRDTENNIRCEAAKALGQIGDPQAVPALIEALQDVDRDVRRAAARALGQIGDSQAVPALRVHAELLSEAKHALEQLNASDFPLTLAVQTLAHQGEWGVLVRGLTTETVQQAVCVLGINAVPMLIQALEDPSTRRAAYRTLGNALIGMIESTFMQGLDDNDAEVRHNAVNVLGQISALTVRELPQKLQDELAYVRSAAAYAIGRICCEHPLEALIEALRDVDAYVRLAAAKALGDLGNPKAIPALERVQLLDPFYNPQAMCYPVREAAQEAIQKIRARQSSEKHVS
ncbi:MAG: HEAT repeat domain-containing protein [Fimbriimonadales bacterium]|nr:HEAT repeat domain-containing protein [Fimbriimonadales bacterium]